MTKPRDCGLSHWTILKIEAYCLFDCDHTKDMFVYNLEGTKLPNPDYDPNAPDRERPDYCPNKDSPKDAPRYICLKNDCPWFACCEAKK